jgi:hypothetical protein
LKANAGVLLQAAEELEAEEDAADGIERGDNPEELEKLQPTTSEWYLQKLRSLRSMIQQLVEGRRLFLDADSRRAEEEHTAKAATRWRLLSTLLGGYELLLLRVEGLYSDVRRNGVREAALAGLGYAIAQDAVHFAMDMEHGSPPLEAVTRTDDQASDFMHVVHGLIRRHMGECRNFLTTKFCKKISELMHQKAGRRVRMENVKGVCAVVGEVVEGLLTFRDNLPLPESLHFAEALVAFRGVLQKADADYTQILSSVVLERERSGLNVMLGIGTSLDGLMCELRRTLQHWADEGLRVMKAAELQLAVLRSAAEWLPEQEIAANAPQSGVASLVETENELHILWSELERVCFSDPRFANMGSHVVCQKALCSLGNLFRNLRHSILKSLDSP